jgi:hypothetical protein
MMEKTAPGVIRMVELPQASKPIIVIGVLTQIVAIYSSRNILLPACGSQ